MAGLAMSCMLRLCPAGRPFIVALSTIHRVAADVPHMPLSRVSSHRSRARFVLALALTVSAGVMAAPALSPSAPATAVGDDSLATAALFATPPSDAARLTREAPAALNALGKAEVLALDFTQSRLIPGVPRTLVSHGDVLLARDQGLAWRTQGTRTDEFVLTLTGAFTRGADGVARPLPPQAQAATAETAKVLFPLLALDVPKLAERFTLHWAAPGLDGAWRLGLAPKAGTALPFSAHRRAGGSTAFGGDALRHPGRRNAAGLRQGAHFPGPAHGQRARAPGAALMALANHARRGLWQWLALMAVLGAIILWRLPHARLATDILALLPVPEEGRAAASARTAFNTRAERQVSFLVGASTGDAARAAAGDLLARLQQVPDLATDVHGPVSMAAMTAMASAPDGSNTVPHLEPTRAVRRGAHQAGGETPGRNPGGRRAGRPVWPAGSRPPVSGARRSAEYCRPESYRQPAGPGQPASRRRLAGGPGPGQDLGLPDLPAGRFGLRRSHPGSPAVDRRRVRDRPPGAGNHAHPLRRAVPRTRQCRFGEAGNGLDRRPGARRHARADRGIPGLPGPGAVVHSAADRFRRGGCRLLVAVRRTARAGAGLRRQPDRHRRRPHFSLVRRPLRPAAQGGGPPPGRRCAARRRPSSSAARPPPWPTWRWSSPPCRA